MDFREMRYVLTIYEEGSLTKAARKLHISQPSLSKFLSSLERNGTLVFDRHTSPIRLTEFGQRYVATARLVLNLTEELNVFQEGISSIGAGTLRVGVTVSQGLCLMPQVLTAFSQLYKHIRVVLTEAKSSELRAKLQDGLLDVIFMDGASNLPSEYVTELLRNERFYLATPPHMLPDGPKTFDYATTQMSPEMMKFILLHPGQRFRSIAEHVFAEYGITPQVMYETQMSTTAIRLCLRGVGLTFVSSLVRDNFHADVEPDYYILDERFTNAVIAGYRRSTYLPPSVRPFIDLFKKFLSIPGS